MELPVDIWEKILLLSIDKKSCENLFQALPSKMQEILIPSYENTLDNYRDIYLIFVQNIILIFKNNDLYKIKQFNHPIRSVEFSPFFNSLLVLLNNNIIFYYNYNSNYIIDIDIPSNEITRENPIYYFYQNNYSNELFLVLAKFKELYYIKYVDEIPLKMNNIFSINYSGNKKFIIVPSKKTNEIATYVYYKINNRMFFDLKIINHKTNEIVFHDSSVKIRAMCYDDFDNFFYCDNEFIYYVNINNTSSIYSSIWFELYHSKIEKLVACKELIFYSAYNKYEDISIVYCVYYNFYEDDEFHNKILSINKSVVFMKIYRNGKVLVVGTNEELLFYNLEEKKNIRTINICEIVNYLESDENLEMNYDLLIN